MIGIFPNQFAKGISRLFSFMTWDMAWFFLWLGVICFGFFIFFLVSKYGDIRLGGAGAKPQYGRFTWIAMMICAALAAGILIFGTVEWMYYVNGTPFGIKANSIKAYEYASAYGLFHWGFSAWAFCLPPGLAIGYMYWNKKAKSWKLSDCCQGVFGDDGSKYKKTKVLLDAVNTFCFVVGVFCTTGLGTSMLSYLISYLTGLDDSFALQISVICLFCIFFILAASKSIAKGMAKISNLNVKLAVGFFAYVFLVGPKAFTLNNFTMAIGTNIREFVHMSFNTDAIAQTGFVQSWTIFYWSWFVALSIITGVWLARISYGRTFREIAFANTVCCPMACWVTFAILGNYGMGKELAGEISVSGRVAEIGNNAATLEVLKSLPFAKIAIVVFLVLLFFNLATSCTSISTSIAMLTSKGLELGEEPRKSAKVFWGVMCLVIPVGFLFIGHVVPGIDILTLLKSMTSVFALPLLPVIGVLLWSFYRTLKKDEAEGILFVDDDKRWKWESQSNRVTK